MTISLKSKKSAKCSIDVQDVAERMESINLNKPVTLQPHSRFVIDTGILVTADEDCDILWVNAGINSDKTNDTEDEIPHYMISERYTKTGCEEPREIVLVGYYDGDEEITLEKGTCVARLHYALLEANDRVLDASHELKSNAIFSTEELLICVMKDEEIDNYKVETIQDTTTNETYIKVTKKVGQDE